MVEFLVTKLHDPHFMTMLLAAIAASATVYTLVMPLFAGEGLSKRMKAVASERERIRQAGIELAPGELLGAATGGAAELEGITAVYFLTAEDDFNALAAVILRGSVEGTVHRLNAPADSHGVVAPFIGGEVLFGADLTWPTFSRRYEDGAAVLGQPARDALRPGSDLLFLVRRDGRLDPVTGSSTPLPRPGDTAVLLAPGRRGTESPPE